MTTTEPAMTPDLLAALERLEAAFYKDAATLGQLAVVAYAVVDAYRASKEATHGQ